MRLSFHGADRTVTGSCHLLECGGRRILVDCGLYQGGRELDEENAEDFGFDPASIDCVLLTHAHLDHCGRLPLLAKRGFRGEIVATMATFELARLVLLDSAHLQEEEARHRSHHPASTRSAVPDSTPLYSTLDALDCIGLFGRSATYGQPIAILPDILATFFDAGHILGSASILLDVQDGERRRSLLFSGDIGNAGRPLLRAPQTPLAAEIVVMETTYGDRLHRPFDASVEELYEAINATLHRGGNILIPTFALERTQDMLFCLHKGIEQSRLPPSLTVFLDSPMAISATEIFKRHPEAYRESAAVHFDSGGDPFGMPGLRFARERAESMAIDRITGGAVIMAGSGMCTGGRIRYHLRNNLSRSEASVVCMGFAAGKTLARRIIDGARTVRILGEDIAVRAHVHTINGFSAHADQAELLQWHDAIQGKQATFLVHGEESVMKLFAAKLHSGLTELPAHGQQFDL